MTSSGVDGDAVVHPILVDADGRPYVLLSDGVEIAQITGAGRLLVQVAALSTDGVNFMPSGDIRERPIHTTPGFQDDFHVHLHADAIGADTGLMLIDLSDTANWPHTNTGGVTLHRVIMSIAATKLTDAHVCLGWLDDVDATDGDLKTMFAWEIGHAGTNEPRDIDTTWDYTNINYRTGVANWFGPTDADNILFQTDVNLFGPDGTVAFPSGDGDLVLLVKWTAGSINVACSIDYETWPLV